MKVEVQAEAKGDTRGYALVHNFLSLTLTFAFLSLSACGRSEEPVVSSAAPPTARPAADAPQPAPPLIETALVELSPAMATLSLAGKVAYGEDRYSRISSPLQGRVLEVRAKLGDHVKAGDILLVVDSPEITAAYSDFVKEASELEYATRAYELAKDLYETKAIPQKDLKIAENDAVKAKAEFRRAKERLLSLKVPAEELDKPLAQQQITSTFKLKSPLAGTVVERTVTPGQSVGGESGQVLFTVADLNKLQVVADVYERDLALVKVGEVGYVTVEAYPGEHFPAVIATIGDVVDPSTRTIKVRAWVTNEEQRLKPEMFARLHLQVGESTPLLAVPKEAVLEADGKHYVYVVEAEGRYTKRLVTVSATSNDLVRIVEGLKPGERIVTKGAVLIKGQEVKG